MLCFAEGFVSCPLVSCHGYRVVPSHASRDPAACAAITLACGVGQNFFSFPWKQNSTAQILNDNDPKQRLIHHQAFKRHFDIIGNVNPGISITNAVEAFDCSPGRGLFNLTRLYCMFLNMGGMLARNRDRDEYDSEPIMGVRTVSQRLHCDITL